MAERLTRSTLWLLATFGGVLAVAEMTRRGVAMPYEASTCLFRQVTGVQCPVCGFTRAFFAMMRGEWREVFVLHPLAPFAALETAVIWAVCGAWAAGWRLPFDRARIERFAERLILFNAALFIAVWGVRLYFH